MTEAEARGDAIAEQVHETVYGWLRQTAGTAADSEDVVHMVVGATAGLAQFCWETRDASADLERVLRGLTESFRQCLVQFAALDKPRGSA